MIPYNYNKDIKHQPKFIEDIYDRGDSNSFYKHPNPLHHKTIGELHSEFMKDYYHNSSLKTAGNDFINPTQNATGITYLPPLTTLSIETRNIERNIRTIKSSVTSYWLKTINNLNSVSLSLKLYMSDLIATLIFNIKDFKNKAAKFLYNYLPAWAPKKYTLKNGLKNDIATTSLRLIKKSLPVILIASLLFMLTFILPLQHNTQSKKYALNIKGHPKAQNSFASNGNLSSKNISSPSKNSKTVSRPATNFSAVNSTSPSGSSTTSLPSNNHMTTSHTSNATSQVVPTTTSNSNLSVAGTSSSPTTSSSASTPSSPSTTTNNNSSSSTQSSSTPSTSSLQLPVNTQNILSLPTSTITIN